MTTSLSRASAARRAGLGGAPCWCPERVDLTVQARRYSQLRTPCTGTVFRRMANQDHEPRETAMTMKPGRSSPTLRPPRAPGLIDLRQ